MSKTLNTTFYLVLLLISSCAFQPTIPDGLWMRKNLETGLETKMKFSGDSVFVEDKGWMKYEISGHELILFRPNKLESNLKYAIKNLDAYTLRTYDVNQKDSILFEKSKSNDRFAFFTDNYNIRASLPKGYSNQQLSNKRPSEFIYANENIDSIFINEDLISYEDFLPGLQNLHTNFSTLFVLFLDENLSFKSYREIYQSVQRIEKRSFKIYHALNNIPYYCKENCPPWETITYEDYNMRWLTDIPNFGEISSKVNIYNIEIQKDDMYKVNEKTFTKALLNSELMRLYNIAPEKTLFNIIVTNELTYGQFITLSSFIKHIVYQKREAYSKQVTNKGWKQVQNDSRNYYLNTGIRDTLSTYIKSNFIEAIFVDDSTIRSAPQPKNN